MTLDAAVRSASLADLAELAALAQVTHGAPHWTEAQYQSLLQGDGSHAVFVVELGGRVSGFCVVACMADQAELESIVVAGELRRRGLGRTLSARALSWAAERGAHEMWLEVRESNAAAQALYHSLRFEVTGKRPAYYANPREDAVLMRAILMAATHI